MSAKPQFFRIGLFILVGIVILVAALLAFGGGQMFRPKILAETYVGGSVQGVDIGSPVKFRGVPIGKVTAISFAFTEYDTQRESGLSNYVVLYMEIDREVFPDMFTENLTPLLNRGIEQGLRVRIEPQGITGLNYLDFDYLDPVRFPVQWPTWKPRYYFIPSAPGQLTSFLDSINAILREVEKLNIGGISKAGTELLDNLNAAVTEAQIGKISQDLQTLVAHFDATMTSAKIPELSTDARKFLNNLEASNSDLQKILKNLEPATRIDAAQLKAVINNLATTTANLAQLSTEVKKRPSLILWGSPPATPKPSPTPRRR